MVRAGAEPDAQRRAFLAAATGALVLLAAPRGFARPPLLTVTEPDAVILEFVEDVARIDPAAQPLYKPGSRCAGCFFYQGDAADDSAACTVFAGWRVPRSGWCREFAPRR